MTTPTKSSTQFFEETASGSQPYNRGSVTDPYREALQRVRDAVTKRFTPQEIQNAGPQVAEFVRLSSETIYMEMGNEAALKGIPRIPMEMNLFVSKAASDLMGMGELDPLLADQGIEDVAINGPDEVYIFKHGGWSRVDVKFSDSNRLIEILNRGISGSNRQVNQVNPIADAVLPGKERISVVSYPVVVDSYPVAVIRAQRAKGISMFDLARANPAIARLEEEQLNSITQSPIPDYSSENGPGAMLTDVAASYLHAAVLAGMNIVVLGPTGVGKTTMLTALGRCIPVGERIMIIEDTPEIKLHPETPLPMNVIPVRTRPTSLEGVPAVTQEDLVRLALRQRPSALTLGEARGAEIYDLLNALMTGHKNGLTSLHTFSASEMFDRIFLMLAQSEKGRLLDMARAAKLVATTLNIAITLEAVGRVRRVVSITEFTGQVTVEGGRAKPSLQEIFRHTGPRGSLQGPLVSSVFGERFASMGVPQKFFTP